MITAQPGSLLGGRLITNEVRDIAGDHVNTDDRACIASSPHVLRHMDLSHRTLHLVLSLDQYLLRRLRGKRPAADRRAAFLQLDVLRFR